MDTTQRPGVMSLFAARDRADRELADAETESTRVQIRLSRARSRRRRAALAYADALQRVVDAPYQRGRSA